MAKSSRFFCAGPRVPEGREPSFLSVSIALTAVADARPMPIIFKLIGAVHEKLCAAEFSL